MVPVYCHTTWCHIPLNHYHKQYPAIKGSFNACTLHPAVIDAYQESANLQAADQNLPVLKRRMYRLRWNTKSWLYVVIFTEVHNLYWNTMCSKCMYGCSWLANCIYNYHNILNWNTSGLSNFLLTVSLSTMKKPKDRKVTLSWKRLQIRTGEGTEPSDSPLWTV
jgi:hypothetical protein